jgi:hypothetical protein
MNTGERLRTKLRRTLSPPATPPNREKYRHLRAKPHTPRALAPGLRLRFRNRVDFAPEIWPPSPIAKCNSTLRPDFPDNPRFTGKFGKITGKHPRALLKTCVKSVGFGKFPISGTGNFLERQTGNCFWRTGNGIAGIREPLQTPAPPIVHPSPAECRTLRAV